MNRVNGAFEGTGDSRKTAEDVAGKIREVGVAIVVVVIVLGERAAFAEAEGESDSGKMVAKVGMVEVRVGRRRVLELVSLWG